MPFEQNEKSKDFIERVKKLVESGEVKNQAAIVEALKWDKTLMSNVMNGRKNIPNDVYRKFTEVYPEPAPAATEELDYRERYISALERLVERQEALLLEVRASLRETNERLIAVEKGLGEAKKNQQVMYALQSAFQEYLLTEVPALRSKEEDALKKVVASAAAYLKKHQKEDIRL